MLARAIASATKPRPPRAVVMAVAAVRSYEEISVKEALKLPEEEYRHASHVMVYAHWPGKLFGKYEHKYAIMMQFRFDGTIGFPGGIVDKGESPHAAAEREFREECGYHGLKLSCDDHVISHYSKHTGLCLHFYSKEVSMAMLLEAEKCVAHADHWGTEVLGSVRCPLYTLPNGLGFPAFLRHQFIGNSRQQLLSAITRRGLLSKEELKEAIEMSSKINGIVTKDEIDY